MKHKNTHLIQIGPDYKTMYLSDTLEKVPYLEINKDYTKESLEADVKSGGALYGNILTYLNHHWEKLPTRYAIQCNDEELGLAAAQIIAQVILSSDTETAKRIRGRFRAHGITEEEKTKEAGSFVESASRLPVVDYQEIALDLQCDDYDPFGDEPDPDDFEFSSNDQWWKHVEHGMVVVRRYASRDYSDNQPDPMGSKEGTFTMYTSCALVFYLLIDDREEQGEEDHANGAAEEDDEEESGGIPQDVLDEVSKRMDREIRKSFFFFTLNNGAGVVSLKMEEQSRREYYRAAFTSAAESCSLQVSGRLNVDEIIDLFLKIHRPYKIGVIKAALRYIAHGRTRKGPLINADFAVLRTIGLVDQDSEGTAKEKKADALQRLNEQMVCQDGARGKIEDIVQVMMYDRARKKLGCKSEKAHNVLLFIGPSGTGKTSMAGFLAKALAERHLVRDDSFLSISGARLKGEYVGQTAHKVHKIFENYSVIFIDEAYSLISNDSLDSGDLFAQEAMAQLAVEIEEHSDDRCVIFAGYGEGSHTREKDNLMKQFISANPGIASRIAQIVYFQDYTADEMVKILHRQAENGLWRLDHSCDEELRQYFEKRRLSPTFGNGREARTVIEHAQMQAAIRLSKLPKSALTKEAVTELTPADVRGALKDLRRGYQQERASQRKRYGF